MSSAANFPAARSDDDGDVHWALTTAAALWAKGDGAEALKWLRRAAESASDANQDARSLELFKAAADVTSRLQSGPPEAPPPTMGPGSMPPRTELAPPVMAPQPFPPQAAPAHKSAPPPPPRRGGGQGPRSMVEPMANTVPGPRPGPPPMPAPQAAPPPMPPASPHSAGHPTRAPQTPKMPITPSAPTRISGRAPVSTSAGKTLASNLTYEQAKDTAAEIRRAVAKTVQPDGRARPMPTAAKIASDRTTHPGMGPPVTTPPAEQPPPSSRGKRRTTQTGRKHAGAVAAARAQIGEINRQSSPEAHRTPTVVFTAVQPPTDVAIHEAAPSELSRTQRFEDEGTIAEKEEKEPTLIGVSFPDLDEQTNVLTGKQTSAVLDGRHSDENGIDVSIESATDPGEAIDADTRQTALPRGLLSAFRVAVSEVSGKLEIVPLVPGEPTPAGAVGCMMVATDVQSSVALADLLGKRVRKGQR